MPLDEIPAVAFKLESLTVILADEIRYARLSVSDACAKVGCETPLELLGRGVDILVWFVG